MYSEVTHVYFDNNGRDFITFNLGIILLVVIDSESLITFSYLKCLFMEVLLTTYCLSNKEYRYIGNDKLSTPT